MNEIYKHMLVASAVAASLTGCGGSGDDFINVPNSVAVQDVNGDGAMDLLVATTKDQGDATNPGFAAVFLGSTTSPGSFASPVRYATTGSNPSSIATADFLQSGSIDLVIANFGSGSVSVFNHDPANSGAFLQAVDFNTGGQPNEVVTGDLNGDGYPDLALADFSSNGNVTIVMQTTTTTQSPQFSTPVNLNTGNFTGGVAIGDLNGDGKLDVVGTGYDSNGNNGRVSVFFQDPATPGSFLARVDFPAGAQPQSVKIADLDGDGLPDIVVANQGPGTDGVGSSGASVLLQDPANPGTFLSPVTYATQAAAVSVAAADLNGDGLVDLVVANLGPSPFGSTSVLLQDATRPGVFLTATSFSGFGAPLGVAIADLNNDTRPDIAVADATTATVQFQSATTAGSFASPAVVSN